MNVMFVVVALAAVAAAGWHARGSSVAGADLRAAKTKIPVLRRNRNRGAAIAVAVAAVVLLAMYDLARAAL